ncbi:hypothetical protein I6N95_15405 [Vagococcus sp. BWB3-3]|uniref:Uncharacterized protein n=1 Tax=Vagococcus allomyrinae TaxID=2794353 RepID=A0A940SVJ6_9ENTE|nr:hypothetical protein [Vagococcus allomyrinae]MBP1042405.1 hypothetical protein [Vagococcus allomyrinae]
MTPIDPNARKSVYHFLEKLQAAKNENQIFRQELLSVLEEKSNYPHLPYFAQPKLRNLVKTAKCYLMTYYVPSVDEEKTKNLLKLLANLKVLKYATQTEDEIEMKALHTMCQHFADEESPVVPPDYQAFLWFIWKLEQSIVEVIRLTAYGDQPENRINELRTILGTSETLKDDRFPIRVSYEYTDISFEDMRFIEESAILAGTPHRWAGAKYRYVAHPPEGYEEKVAELFEWLKLEFFMTMPLMPEMTPRLDQDLHNLVYAFLKESEVI